MSHDRTQLSPNDIRRHQRMFLKVGLRIDWRDAYGCFQSCLAQSVDASEGGLRLALAEYVAPRTLVFIRTNNGRESLAAATVRHCTRRGMKYFVGLELCEGGATPIIEACVAAAS